MYSHSNSTHCLYVATSFCCHQLCDSRPKCLQLAGTTFSLTLPSSTLNSESSALEKGGPAVGAETEGGGARARQTQLLGHLKMFNPCLMSQLKYPSTHPHGSSLFKSKDPEQFGL